MESFIYITVRLTEHKIALVCSNQ